VSVWSYFFAWYQGAVYSNLIASAICAGIVWWRARVHLRLGHERRRADLAAHHEAIRQTLAEHHTAVKDHITAVLGVQPQDGEPE
jgi:hypothetical protein